MMICPPVMAGEGLDRSAALYSAAYRSNETSILLFRKEVKGRAPCPRPPYRHRDELGRGIGSQQTRSAPLAAPALYPK